ncbi:MAG: EAL domain-containing protein [Ruminococcus sp.]|nr:EAL domain-containing protein [Ruminococcus sp.]
MLLFAARALRGKSKAKGFVAFVIVTAALVFAFEIDRLIKYDPKVNTVYDLQNYLILLFSSLLLITFSVIFLKDKEDKKWQSLTVMYLFSAVCINFGIIISVNSYATGGQMLTFLTMELFVVCLLVWRPWLGFAVLTASYLIFYTRISTLIDLSTVAKFTGVIDFSAVKPGLGDGIKINGFTMWLSTLMFCIANYNKTLTQAEKDEHLEKMNEHLSRISIMDELTGIHNMVYFRNEAEKISNYVTTDKENMVYLFFDIENFKSYNEKYGFSEGNELLRKIAHMIDDTFKGSLVSRFSDDHFVVLTRVDGSEDRVNELAIKVRGLQNDVHMELKCGAYRPTGSEFEPSLACDRARFACNTIKKRYGTNYRLYNKALEDKFHLKQYIVNNVDHAIENGYIRVFYQPVVSTKDGSVIGLEALARWQDPNYGLLPPGMFIEILEEYRQIHKLDLCMVEQVCKDYRDAYDAKQDFVPISLNFSRLDFELCDIVTELERLTGDYGVPKEYIDVEVTESALTDTQDLLNKALERLRGLGYKVWLDDFGSGYSSLNVLKDYRFDVLKIDMKFLTGFSDNEKTRPILENIVGLTKQLGMVSLTEGVETREQFEFLRSIGCDRAQGYLFSRPVPKDELIKKFIGGVLIINENFRNALLEAKD